ncbi:MAG: putative DNA binding domain-containing protein [Verrucomicrobia bacterium]|nr:putative DNA binding domain-containing protein [Verrucomicrobiota bacterium]
MKLPTLQELLNAKEGENVEFKKATNHFSFDELAKYVCALSNEGGGYMVLGVSDERPRSVVGSSAFQQPERTRAGLMDRIHLRVDFEELEYQGKRVLVFVAPPRPVGMPIKEKGIYWGRRGDRLEPLSESDLRAIFAEVGHDFSAEVCAEANINDLDPVAIEDFRRRWIAKSRNASLSNLSMEQLLHDCEAMLQEGVTYAALVLFGKREALGRLLGQAEIIFEYRSSEASGPAQHREEFRQGFFSYYEKLWDIINLRNDKQHFQEGLFILDVPTFDERSVREAILNAVSHRDYQLGGSVFIRQYPRKLTVDSPGGLPPDVTPENILDRQSPRNRRIADLFARCGLVERSGQGMNLMFELSIKNGKLLPDMRGTDRYHVALTLDGHVQDVEILKMMEEIGQETLATFSTHDFLIVNMIQREKHVPEDFRDRLPRLLDLGILERAGRGRYILGKRYYHKTKRKGTYTRQKGLARETKKELLMKHIRDNKATGSKLSELCEVLPGESRSQVQVYLRELRGEGKIRLQGVTSAGRWFPKT